jgi:hypothetical protein
MAVTKRKPSTQKTQEKGKRTKVLHTYIIPDGVDVVILLEKGLEHLLTKQNLELLKSRNLQKYLNSYNPRYHPLLKAEFMSKYQI